MSALALGVTANQNSIPRELVYDVDAMLDGQLDTVPFPFIGTSVPEGHQGQSVEGMSHGCVLSKLKTGFHSRGIAWSFNADHQPIGGKFDAREDALVRGCLLASYITFDLSLEMDVNFVAPAFGFQKNSPYPDNQALRVLIGQQWTVCREFGASIGFHSGSGKSAANYAVMGQVTDGNLEIKTSGRYAYEMGAALAASANPSDAALWRDWYRFTLDMALAGAFSDDAVERKMARTFIATSVGRDDVFQTPASCRAALEALPKSPEHMFFFEYNFLYVLAAGGRADKTALGDHSPAGYAQRARFYAISEEARLSFAKSIARYIVFLAEHTGLAPAETCHRASRRLERYTRLSDMLDEI
jgi:hypothetical protein